MPRKPRIECGGEVYHVVSRGNRSEGIYLDDTDRELFIEALTEVCERDGWVIHAYVLMDNYRHTNNIPHSVNEVKDKKNIILNRLVKTILTLRVLALFLSLFASCLLERKEGISG